MGRPPQVLCTLCALGEGLQIPWQEADREALVEPGGSPAPPHRKGSSGTPSKHADAASAPRSGTQGTEAPAAADGSSRDTAWSSPAGAERPKPPKREGRDRPDTHAQAQAEANERTVPGFPSSTSPAKIGVAGRDPGAPRARSKASSALKCGHVPTEYSSAT